MRAKLSRTLTGRQKTKEHRQRLSEAGVLLKGDKNPFYGRTHTPETKAVIADSMKGEKGPTYGRVGAKHPMFGTHHTVATKKKMSEQRRGRTQSDLQRKRVREGWASREIATKLRNTQILERADKGEKAADIGRDLGLKTTTIYNILSKLRKK